jgi:hypothetical protein
VSSPSLVEHKHVGGNPFLTAKVENGHRQRNGALQEGTYLTESAAT